MGVPLNIDWQQILLHMFNLIILTGGLYFLLYQPVTAFMKKRQEYYAGLEADAQAKLQEAEQKIRRSPAPRMNSSTACRSLCRPP